MCARSGQLLVARQGLKLLRGGVLRWRLETYGLYMPSLPHARPWWRVNARSLHILLCRRGAYGAWLRDIETLRQEGASGWWQARLRDRYESMQAYMRHENMTGLVPEDPPVP